jgi:NTP pyrophosphatase (non-canonical NTP hydrolase)
MDALTWADYQRLAKRTEKPLEGKAALQHHLMGVASESGELAGAIKAHVIYGKDLNVANVAEEIGDILWYLAGFCNTLGLSLESCAVGNIQKLMLRYPDQYKDVHALARADKRGGYDDGDEEP